MNPPPGFVFPILLLSQLITLSLSTTLTAASGGWWELLKSSVGVSAMHMQLLNNDRIIIFDRTDFGTSDIFLPDGKCRDDPNDTAVKHDCTAHSVEFDVLSGSVRPLMILTDSWCSSGTVAADGHLVQTGGYNDGDRAVRMIHPCDNCDWEEKQYELAVRRWYATNHILPDGRSIILGGRRQINYEFYPKTDASGTGVFNLPFLQQTKDAEEENNLYPFVHLNVDGNLFIFSNNRSILLNYMKNTIVRTYPVMPGGDPRNYPSSGSSVLLPLKPSGVEAEVLICGGAPRGAYSQARAGNFIGALITCGRIKITDKFPAWSMEEMPMRRVMGDMILLPTGVELLIINGASSGSAGWEFGRDPVLSPVIYRHNNPTGSRFEVQNSTTTPRLYHSTATLLRDGRVLIGGSNPHIYYNFTGVTYPTDLSLEAFSPEYLSSGNSNSRPEILTSPLVLLQLSYGKWFELQFSVKAGGLNPNGIRVTMVSPSFVTHSFSMNQRLLILNSTEVRSQVGSSLVPSYVVAVVAPSSSILAPPGYYLLFVVNGGIPSEGIWVHIQ